MFVGEDLNIWNSFTLFRVIVSLIKLRILKIILFEFDPLTILKVHRFKECYMKVILINSCI